MFSETNEETNYLILGIGCSLFLLSNMNVFYIDSPCHIFIGQERQLLLLEVVDQKVKCWRSHQAYHWLVELYQAKHGESSRKFSTNGTRQAQTWNSFIVCFLSKSSTSTPCKPMTSLKTFYQDIMFLSLREYNSHKGAFSLSRSLQHSKRKMLFVALG